MAFEENGTPLVMPVTPSGNGGFGGGFGGDFGWIVLLLLLGWNNGGFGGGYGGNQLGYDFPWLLNGQNSINANTNAGFQNALLNDNITGIRDGINGITTQLCNGFAGIEQGANARQIANMQSIFGVQSALQNCCCENRANIADLKYTVAQENCADRAAVSDGIRDVIESQTRSTQLILDKLCQQELDALKQSNLSLQNQLNMATLRESQTAQNALITKGFTDEVDALYNRLSNCPVPSTPVYGRTPIFTCSGNNGGCGCGCGNF